MALKLLETGLECVATLSEGETNTIWGSGNQGYFYINKEDSKNLPSFCNGVQICEVQQKELNEYFFQGFQIANKYKSMFKKEDFEKFATNKAYFENEKVVKFYMLTKKGQGNGQSHIKIINNYDTRNIEELRDHVLDKNFVNMGEKLRQSIIAGITKVRFEEKDGKILVTLGIIDKWGDVLMGKSNYVELQKLIIVFEQEIDHQCQAGKELKEAAQIFGIRYQPVIYKNNMDIADIINGSKYSSNAAELIEAVSNGMKISPDIIWETYSKEEKKKDLKEEFKSWLSKQYTKKGTPWAEGSIAQCIRVLVKGFNNFDKYEDYDSFFEITKLSILNDYQSYLKVKDGVDGFDKQENTWFSKGLEEYELFLQDYQQSELEKLDEITYETSCDDEITLDGKTIKLERNRIFFGAPGTGKSFELDKQTKIFAATSYERVTFHPEYTHSAFFGTYKPVPNPNDRDKITYAFIPGPFLRVLSKALINANVEINPHPFVLLIEEINRANMAAVFGEVFQLLDRDDNNVSKYSISPSEDVKKYLVDEFAIAGINIEKEAFNELRIPNNMFIWASMNSADQGVFPMDTAFKRRWDFEYFNIDQNKDVISSYTFNVAGSDINWNSLRKAINQRLTELRINEDKLMGPFFIGTSVLESGDDTKIINTIKNKVIMYLFEDAARQKRKDVFVKGFEKTYSQICNDFETDGLKIFTQEIIDFYNKNIK